MKIIKIFLSIIIVTVVSLVYINQQFGLAKLGYSLKISENTLENLAETNRFLKGGVAKLSSPSLLEEKVSFAAINPERWRVARAIKGISPPAGEGLKLALKE